MQQLPEAQMTQHIGAAPYERSEKCSGQPNGYMKKAENQGGALNLRRCFRTLRADLLDYA